MLKLLLFWRAVRGEVGQWRILTCRQAPARVIFKLPCLPWCVGSYRKRWCFGVHHTSSVCFSSPAATEYPLVMGAIPYACVAYIIRIRFPLSIWLLWVCEEEWEMFHLAKYSRCVKNVMPLIHADLTETLYTLQDWHAAGRFETKRNSTGSWVRRKERWSTW